MLKEKAVAALGQKRLLLPAWITAALKANDRLKLYLSMLQAASAQADAHRDEGGGEWHAAWGAELQRAGLQDASWIQEMVLHAYRDEGQLMLAHQARMMQALATDVQTMARPIIEAAVPEAAGLQARVHTWQETLQKLGHAEGLDPAALQALTRGDRHAGDSLHLLVMDMHRTLNALASQVETENLDGAHVWNILPEDRPLVRAFMRGLARTAALKFGHPGLDTAVTRDGARLLIQNDIGTNDAHVLVIEVEEHGISLTYSDLHVPRFAFFRRMLEQVGYGWEVDAPVATTGLNEGKPYTVGHASLQAQDSAELVRALEATASRIVFVIDWNRARKKLQAFVPRREAVALLDQAARQEWGHMGWLLAGGEALVYRTMESVGGDTFRLGERLDGVLGETGARLFLSELLRECSELLRAQQPLALVEDKARLLLGRALRQRHVEFDLLAEHAAYCHALAQALCDALARDDTAGAASDMATRARGWEHRADHLLAEARERAERQPRWQGIVDLLLRADDVADALEESAFVHTLVRQPELVHPPEAVQAVLARLADTTLAAIQDLVKAIEIARVLDGGFDPLDSDAFLQALWRMIRAERLCDDLLREARVQIVRTLHAHPAQMALVTELAATLERASDALVATGYALRRLVFDNTGVPT